MSALVARRTDTEPRTPSMVAVRIVLPTPRTSIQAGEPDEKTSGAGQIAITDGSLLV